MRCPAKSLCTRSLHLLHLTKEQQAPGQHTCTDTPALTCRRRTSTRWGTQDPSDPDALPSREQSAEPVHAEPASAAFQSSTRHLLSQWLSCRRRTSTRWGTQDPSDPDALPSRDQSAEPVHVEPAAAAAHAAGHTQPAADAAQAAQHAQLQPDQAQSRPETAPLPREQALAQRKPGQDAQDAQLRQAEQQAPQEAWPEAAFVELSQQPEAQQRDGSPPPPPPGCVLAALELHKLEMAWPEAALVELSQPPDAQQRDGSPPPPPPPG